MRLWLSKDNWVNPLSQVDKPQHAYLHTCTILVFEAVCYYLYLPQWIAFVADEVYGILYEVIFGCLWDFFKLVKKDGISLYDIVCNNAGMLIGHFVGAFFRLCILAQIGG